MYNVPVAYYYSGFVYAKCGGKGGGIKTLVPEFASAYVFSTRMKRERGDTTQAYFAVEDTLRIRSSRHRNSEVSNVT